MTGAPVLRLLGILVLALMIPAASAAASALHINEELVDYQQTSGSGKYGNVAPYGTEYTYGFQISDISLVQDLNYIAIATPYADYIDLDEGSHDFTYHIGTLGSKTGRVHVTQTRGILGQITSERAVFFFDDWDIENLVGEQILTLNEPIIRGRCKYYQAQPTYSGDSIIWIQGAIGATYEITHVSSLSWRNNLQISSSGGIYEISVVREFGSDFHISTIRGYDDDGVTVLEDTWNTDKTYLVPPPLSSVVITAPSGLNFTYPLAPTETTSALYGDVIDAYTGNPIQGATITATQPSIDRTVTATSNAAGAYSTAGKLLADRPVTITASAPGYADTTLSFTAVPRYASWYVSLLMVPTTLDIPTDPEKTALYGYVVTRGNQQPIQGATISIDGIGSTTTSSTGFYIFANVTPATYTITASAPQHDTLTESVTADATLTQHNLALAGHHSLTVTVKDADTLKILTNATTISLSDGQSANDQNPATFAVDYGQYTILAAAEGYTPTQQYQYIDQVGDTQATILLPPKTVPPTPPEMPNYPPHNVKFTIQTLLGTPISGVSVTAQGIQQTPSSNLLERLLGINTTTTPINTELMSGTTDTNGEINFMMVEAVKYQISIYKPDVVNQTLEIYPKEDTYPIIISTAGGPLLPDAGDALRDIRINVTTSTEGDTGHIHIDYNDTTRKTTGLTIQVTQQNTTDSSAPEDVIDTHTVANDANVSRTFDLSVYKGQSFFVRLEAEHPDFGTINRDYAVAFKGVRVPLGPLPDGLYIYVAGFGLMLLGGIFGATSATRGVVVIAFAGWLFYAFGWLDDLGLIAPVSLGLVSTLAVMGIIVTRYREEGYT